MRCHFIDKALRPCSNEATWDTRWTRGAFPRCAQHKSASSSTRRVRRREYIERRARERGLLLQVEVLRAAERLTERMLRSWDWDTDDRYPPTFVDRLLRER